MRSILLATVTFVVGTLAVSAGCGPSGDSAGRGDDGGEAGNDVGDEAVDDAGRSEGSVGDAAGAAGPLSLVVEEVEVVADRLCDVDGDGVDDNAIADLGSTSAALLAGALTALIQASIDRGSRLMIHSPRLDDIEAPADDDLILAIFEAEDTDVPVDVSDDFSGEEPFYVRAKSIDECGEPRSVLLEASIVNGELVARDGALLIPMTPETLLIRGGQLFGLVAPGGHSGELEACGYASTDDIGAMPAPSGGGDRSVLEAFLAGGDSFGLPTVPGVTPDVDLDGDGLERFELDEDARIAACIDGDLTVIEGADCWRDARIADGFSINFTFAAVGAVFAGRLPNWQEHVGGVCDSLPETSLWDPS